jgi:type IV pilus assembly protein PilX
MLTRPYAVVAGKSPHKQGGVVLMIALIVLVAMTLAGIALVRSVDTSNVIAGNLAFQQSATNAADTATESAIAWLENKNTGTTLHVNDYANGYAAFRADPAAGQSWDAYWNGTLTGQKATLAADPVTGNTVAYAIQRLCLIIGDPSVPGTACSVSSSTSSAAATSSQDVGNVTLFYSSQRYYRITSRIAGPRNTVSYVQTIVSM